MAFSFVRNFNEMWNRTLLQERDSVSYIKTTEAIITSEIENIRSLREDDKFWISIFVAIIALFLGANIFADFKYLSKVSLLLRLTVKTAIGALLNIVILPCVFAVYVVLWTFSKANDIYARFATGGEVTRAAGMDKMWALDSPQSQAFVYGSFKAEGVPDVEGFKKHFTKRVLEVKSASGCLQFQKLMQLTFNCGVYSYCKNDENFDINNHISLKRVSDIYPKFSSQEGISGQDLVNRYLGDNGSDPIAGGKAPKWEMVILVTGKKEFFYIFRCHHEIADGLSYIRLLLEYANDEPIPNKDVCAPPSFPVRIAMLLWSVSLIPYALTYLIYKGRNNPLHGPKLSGIKHYISIPGIPFSKIREIKNRAKITVHDILFSSITSAFGNIFQRRYPSWVTVFFPIGFSDPKAELKLQNSFLIGLASLPVPAKTSVDDNYHHTDTSLLNLYNTNKALRRVSEDPTLTAFYYILTMFVDVIPNFLCRIINNTSGITFGVSNVPGPPRPLSVMKQKLTEWRFWGPDRAPLGIVVTFGTHDGVLLGNIRIDDALVKSRQKAEELGKLIFEEIERLAITLNIKETSVGC